MGLKVIGAGWGRTGTESLKKALELIGFGKCYHAFELIKDGKRIVYWEQLARGEKPEYDKLFEGYQSAVDFPSAMYYKEFMEQYPDAKVILSYRDAASWYESASKTILRSLPSFLIPVTRFIGLFNKNISYFPRTYAIMMNLIHDQFMEGKNNDRVFMINLYNQ
ncbi:MAG: sulfotransferase family protein [Lewinellaceae bacterium]|nr:sulfotransferase family protein [Lewinellaceae bacterium]